MQQEVLNQTTNDEVKAYLECAIEVLRGGHVASLKPLAPFVTLDLLHRFHEAVVAVRQSGNAEFSKHMMLAACVLQATGVQLPPDRRDTDKIGNHLDVWLKRQFIDVDRKLLRKRRVDTREKCREDLRIQCLRIGNGGRVEHYGGPFLDLAAENANPQLCSSKAPYVRYTRAAIPAPMGFLELKEAVNISHQEALHASANLERERERVSRAKRRVDDYRDRVETAQRLMKMARSEKDEASAEASTIRHSHKQLEHDLKQLQLRVASESAARRRVERDAARLQIDVEAKVHRLGHQVAQAMHDAAIAAGHAERAQKELCAAQQSAAAEAQALRDQLMRVEADSKQLQREAERERNTTAATLHRLGSQAARASQEAGVASLRAEHAQQNLLKEQRRAASEAEMLRGIATDAEKEVMQMERQSLKVQQKTEAALLRLGSQAARASQEAGVLAEKAKVQQNALAEAQSELFMANEAITKLAIERKELAEKYKTAKFQKDSAITTSKRRLEAKKSMSERVESLVAECETMQEELEKLRKEKKEHNDVVAQLQTMPTWRHIRATAGRGGGRKLEYTHRLAILQQHANGTPPSAIGRNIVSVVKATAPWLNPVEPTIGEIRKIGFELTVLEEALAARKVASAFRVRLLGFDETQDRQEPSITSNVQIQPEEDGPLEDCVLKAAYLSTKGGESAALVEEVEGKCFARLRELLGLWKQTHKEMFPDTQWTGPPVERCSLHRLAGGGALMSDTCNAARKSKALMQELIQQQAETYISKEMTNGEWDALTGDEKAEKIRVNLLDCHQHLRNIILSHMSVKQAQHVKEELQHDLLRFASWERMDTDFNQLLRAVYKEFHQGGRYYKGKGAEFASWMLERHPSAFYMHIERAEGGRQDLDYDAAVPIYINRAFLVEYLHTVVFNTGHKNVLEDFLYTACRTVQFIAMSRANALIDLRISKPMRWLAGKSAELRDWSPYKNNQILDLVYDVFQKGKDNGAVLLDPNLDVFEKVIEEQPLFRSYMEYTSSQDSVMSPDGRTRHLLYKLALEEVLNPKDETNKAVQDKTIEYLQVQCKAALEKMEDRKLAIADKLSALDGHNSFGKSAQAHADTKGCHATNDRMAESVFGAYKYERQRLPGISQRRASGLAQSRVMKSLAHRDAVQHRASRKELGSGKGRFAAASSTAFGYFHRLPSSEAQALVEMARLQREGQRKLDRSDIEELDAFRAARRKSNSELELQSLIRQFALGLSFFDRFKQRGVKSRDEMIEELKMQASEQAKLDWLREQIEMRVIGLCWVEFKAHWSSGSNESVGSVEDLTEHLIEILEEQEEREIPENAPAPIMLRKTFKELGTPTVQAETLADQRLSMSSEDLLKAAERERKRLEDSLELDTVGDQQPKQAPALDQALVGRQLEIRWRYWRPAEQGERGKKKQVFIWCEGTVVEVSDGTIRKSKRSKDSIPSGAVRIRWPADTDFDERETFQWSILNPEDWNRDVHLGWRWPQSELSRMYRG